ncbi:hypothetical protein M8330_08080 [Nocardioides sp. BSK12Z-4]|uniref:Uncharacterized protein n=2 Tax=Nocardioides bruguierae TaxID=2945102 RepID=A0A9X2D7I2_9ACTN|nr:hypothetical protein [Nocardioides bruguierae]
MDSGVMDALPDRSALLAPALSARHLRSLAWSLASATILDAVALLAAISDGNDGWATATGFVLLLLVVGTAMAVVLTAVRASEERSQALQFEYATHLRDLVRGRDATTGSPAATGDLPSPPVVE